jgi:GT2 family glycosyltransferase
LRYFLEGEYYPSFEVIVVDQSTNHDAETRHFLAAASRKLTYIDADYQNLPRARNQGAALARAEIVVYVDDDVEPLPGFLHGHAEAYADPTIIGVTGPAPGPGKPLLGRAEIGEDLWADLMACRRTRFNVNFPYPARWAVGCNMSFRKRVILDVGGFDENFVGPAGEDTEFSYRARTAGTILYSPAAHLVHLQSPSGGHRDAAGRTRYITQTAFCTNYFWFKVGARRSRRTREVLLEFRKHVVNRYTLRNGSWLPFAVAFLRGVRDSERVIRRIRIDAA